VRIAAALVVALAPLAACSSEAAAPASAVSKSAAPATVGYDIRRLRPKVDEPLAAMFDRVFAQALADGKTVAVLFSADWCEPCRALDLELGNTHPAGDIAHVRILELKEEDWQAVTRMDEFDALRRRWYPQTGSYPVFVLLDRDGGKIEEMKEAVERLEREGVAPTVAMWFRGVK
jgi:thiol-disulfide isomerase/thioredoxin